MKMRKIVAIVAAALMLFSIMPFSAMAAAGDTHTVDFSTISGSVQYADETHDLGGGISLHIVNCHINTQLRVYSSSTNNGVATFSSAEPIASMVINAGNKADTLNISVSDDGSTWTLDQTVATTGTYTEYTVELSAPSNYVQLDVAGTNQVRIKSIVFTFGEGGSGNVCAHEYTYECDKACALCGVTTRPAAQCVNDGPVCTDGQCQYCGAAVAGTGHQYDNDYDADCNICGEVREVADLPDVSTVTEQDIDIIASTGTVVDKTISWESDNFKYYYEQASSSTAIRTSDTTHFRNYQGSQITISGKNGELISVVEVTCTSDSYATALNNSTKNAGWTSSASGSVVTFTASGPATELVITSGAQWRCNKVHIVPYVSGVCNHTWDNCADTDCNQGCGETREAGVCVYTSAYDTSCSECGATQTVELPAADSELTIPEANDVAMLGGSSYTSGKYYVTGVVESIASTTYGNLYLKDENGNKLYVYGVYGPDGTTRYDSLGDLQPAVGDEITLYGQLGTYSGAGQMKNGWLVVETTVCDECTYSGDYDPTCNVCYTEREVTLPEADTELSFEEVEEVATGRDHNDYTDSKYYVIGTITEVYGAEYGNMYIEDEAGNSLTIYGTYSADGSTRYDAMETKPVAGDKVKLYGIIGNYNGTAQMKNAWVIEHTAHTCVSDSEYECTDGVCTICGAAVAGIGHSYFYPCDVVCQICYQETTPDAAHTIVAVAAKEATCSQNGNIAYWYCSDCGSAWADEALTQVTNQMNVILPATGEHSYFYPCDVVCQICYQETNPDAAHTIVAVAAKEATCSQNGNIAYWYCSDCGSAWADEALTQVTNQMNVIVPATGEHTYDDDYDVDCNVCGDVREVPEKPDDEILYGDADGDGEVTLTDAALLGQWLAGYEVTVNEAAADADGDGEVTLTDAALLGQWLAGYDVTLGPDTEPEPEPEEPPTFNDATLGWE